MEIENHATRQAYIRLLADTQKKKLEILTQLMSLTEQQESLISSSDDFDEEEFLRIISLKEEQINALDKMDEGFQKVYDSVKEELITGKEKYEAEITTLKNLITDITDLSVKLQALEKRNKSRLEVYFSNSRKQIKNYRMNNKSVTNYYKTMTKQHEAQSFFYDKKK